MIKDVIETVATKVSRQYHKSIFSDTKMGKFWSPKIMCRFCRNLLNSIQFNVPSQFRPETNSIVQDR
jgi:hypothetical protein